MSDKTVVDVLRDARALVERGWTQHVMRYGGCFCPVGAVYAVCGYWPDLGSPFQPDMTRRAFEIFEEANGVWGLAEWNDDDARTQAEVLAAFDKAIEAAEATS